MTDQDGGNPHSANDEDSHNNYTLPERLTGAVSLCLCPSRSPTDSAKCVRDAQAPSQFPTNSFTDGELYEKLGNQS
jgi:hypothetical protein